MTSLLAPAGALLGAVSGAVARLRPDGRTLHPRGTVLRGTVHRDGARPPTGVPWLDAAGTDDVLVRVSRSLGLPEPLPDVAGLAIRVPLPGGGHADVLLASCGPDVVTRHLLRPALGSRVRYSTLLPAPSRTGSLLLGADPGVDGAFTLRVCRVGGPWRELGTLELRGAAGPEHQRMRFDPVLHALPGLPRASWEAALREPAYAAARAVGAARRGSIRAR